MSFLFGITPVQLSLMGFYMIQSDKLTIMVEIKQSQNLQFLSNFPHVLPCWRDQIKIKDFRQMPTNSGPAVYFSSGLHILLQSKCGHACSGFTCHLI